MRRRQGHGGRWSRAGRVGECIRLSAPAGLDAAIAPLTDVFVALGEGDAKPFDSMEAFEGYSGLVTDWSTACRYTTVDVEAGDYWFKGFEEPIEAGTVGFVITNISESEMHEVVMFKKNDPEQSAEEILALEESEMETAVTFVAAGFASPGGTGSALAELDAGAYTAVCFVPIGGEDGPPHFTAGQVAEFTVG